ncbi:hypothetical protein [Nostoc sp. UHCC 0870]|uniref:hypothetical protein n=1 Tax=Nostoc sp. UHCC 0870 TaxID=2914041 RepID=UPI001EDF9DF8|nr:hypothetical protein [Nostoc sp. UHCC 0870]UKO97208.1 hypothetical protein L6494_21865 [Nostoc sp. UHCC 0870]
MSKSNLFQKLSSVGLASTISTLTIIGTILTPGIESMAQAATYIGEIGAGNLIPGSGPVTIPAFNTIEGILRNGGDINLYQLQLGFDGKVDVASFEPSLNLFLFDKSGQGLATGFSKLSFSGVKDDIFYLGINGSVALNASGDPILDPSVPNFIGSGTLTSWKDPGIATQALINYRISLTAKPIPETSSTLSLFALGTLGVGSTLKSKLKSCKS